MWWLVPKESKKGPVRKRDLLMRGTISFFVLIKRSDKALWKSDALSWLSTRLTKTCKVLIHLKFEPGAGRYRDTRRGSKFPPTPWFKLYAASAPSANKYVFLFWGNYQHKHNYSRDMLPDLPGLLVRLYEKSWSPTRMLPFLSIKYTTLASACNRSSVFPFFRSRL